MRGLRYFVTLIGIATSIHPITGTNERLRRNIDDKNIPMDSLLPLSVVNGKTGGKQQQIEEKQQRGQPSESMKRLQEEFLNAYFHRDFDMMSVQTPSSPPSEYFLLNIILSEIPYRRS
jgi:hypothetical protein